MIDEVIVKSEDAILAGENYAQITGHRDFVKMMVYVDHLGGCCGADFGCFGTERVDGVIVVVVVQVAGDGCSTALEGAVDTAAPPRGVRFRLTASKISSE